MALNNPKIGDDVRAYDELQTKEINRNTNDPLGQNNMQNSNLRSDDYEGWRAMPSGAYYINPNGVELGYPDNYSLIFHIKGSFNIYTQYMIRGASFYTRFVSNENTAKAWYRHTGILE